MKERGILFSAPMVRALIDGTKTQTRRIVKQERAIDSGGRIGWYVPKYPQGFLTEEQFAKHCCPYGKQGDQLFVRESGWERPGRTASMMRDGADTWPIYEYDADGINSEEVESLKMWGWKRRPSIHMPRWASRITLEIVSVRVERLQDISYEDARAEGVSPLVWAGILINGYKALWESINGDGSWDANPFVWAVEFKRILSEGKS